MALLPAQPETPHRPHHQHHSSLSCRQQLLPVQLHAGGHRWERDSTRSGEVIEIQRYWNANEHFLSGSTVKPDPPINVRVSPKVRSLLVEWSLPPTWAHQDIFPLKYHIRYQRDNWGTPMFVNVRVTLIAHCGHVTSVWAASENFSAKATHKSHSDWTFSNVNFLFAVNVYIINIIVCFSLQTF